jgi:hypothetical protein
MNDVANTQNIMGVELEYFYSLIQKVKALIISQNPKSKSSYNFTESKKIKL